MDKSRITISSGNFISNLAIALIVLKLCGVITCSWILVLMPCVLAVFFLLSISLLYLNTFKQAMLSNTEKCNCTKDYTNPMMYNTDRVSFTSNIFKEKEVKDEVTRKSRSTKRKSKESDSVDKGEESSK